MHIFTYLPHSLVTKAYIVFSGGVRGSCINAKVGQNVTLSQYSVFRRLGTMERIYLVKNSGLSI